MMDDTKNIRSPYFKPAASVKGVIDFITAKEKSRHAFFMKKWMDKVAEKEEELRIAKKHLWLMTGGSVQS